MRQTSMFAGALKGSECRYADFGIKKRAERSGINIGKIRFRVN